MDYSYIDYYGNINYEVKNNAPKASINAGDHPIGAYIASQLTTITDDIQKIVHELAHCGEDEVVTKFKENVNNIYKNLTNINESFKSDYTNAEKIYIELDTSLTTLKNATDELEKLCNNRPSKPIQGDKTDEEYETIKSKWRKNVEKWENNITKLKSFCEELTVQINTYIKYLDSINGLNAIDGKSALSMPNTGALDLNYRQFFETLDTSYDINPNEDKRVYDPEDLVSVCGMDRRYLDQCHDNENTTINYLETLIAKEHTDRSLAAVSYALEQGYITEDEYNRLSNMNNYSSIVDNVAVRRKNNDCKSIDMEFRDQFGEININGVGGINSLMLRFRDRSPEEVYYLVDYAKEQGYISDENYNYLKNPDNYEKIINSSLLSNYDGIVLNSSDNLEQMKSSLNETYPDVRFVNTNNSSLRLRQLPNSDSNILANLPKGTAINVGEKTEDGWRAAYAVVDNQIVEGWVSDEYISEDNPYSSGHLRNFDPSDRSIYPIESEIAAMNALKDIDNV